MQKHNKLLIALVLSTGCLVSANASAQTTYSPWGHAMRVIASSSSSVLGELKVISTQMDVFTKKLLQILQAELVGQRVVETGVASDTVTPAVAQASYDSLVLDLADPCVQQQNVYSMTVDRNLLSPEGQASYDAVMNDFQKNCQSPAFATYYKAIFPNSTLDAAEQAPMQTSEVSQQIPYLDAANFLNKLQYNLSSNDVANVRKYMQYFESTGRGSMLDLSSMFQKTTLKGSDNDSTLYKLMYDPNNDGGYTPIALSSGQYQQILNNERLNDEDYKDQVLSYKTQLVKRSLYMNILLKAFLRRLPSAGNSDALPPKGKSMAQYEHDQVMQRFTDDYKKAIDKANGVTTAKAILQTLNQVLLQLYESNQNAERMMVMQSIAYMPDLNTTAQDKKNILSNIYNSIYSMDKSGAITLPKTTENTAFKAAASKQSTANSGNVNTGP